MFTGQTNMTLLELINLNNHYTGKGGFGNGTDKEAIHKYCSTIYDRIMAPYQDKEIKFFEIGTSHGGSLLLWNDYFSNAKIYSVDNTDRTGGVLAAQYPHIKTYLSDAYNPNFVELLPDFDIVLDDGPHTFESFIQCLNLYLPKVKEGGMLVMEDIPKIEYVDEMIKCVGDLKYEVVDNREEVNRYDNIVFIVYK